jgi:hypothetical protein
MFKLFYIIARRFWGNCGQAKTRSVILALAGVHGLHPGMPLLCLGL